MGMDFRYLLYFEREACLDVLERLGDMAENSAESSTTMDAGDRTMVLPFASWNGTGPHISWDDPSPSWDFMTVLCFQPDDAIESYEADNHQRDELGRAIIGFIYLTVHRNVTAAPSETGEHLVLFEFGTPGSSMSVLFAESESIRRTFIQLLESCRGVYGVLDMEIETNLFWLRGMEVTKPLPTAHLTLAEIEHLIGVEATIHFSFSADAVAATARHLRRMFGGAELGVHHWLSAILEANVPLPDPPNGLSPTTTAEDLRRQLSCGDIGELLSESEVRATATDRARQDGRQLVTAADLAHVILAAANPAVSPGSGASPPGEVHGVVEFYPEGLLHKFGFGDGDMLYEVVEEHALHVDHQDLLIAVVEELVVPQLNQTVETYTMVSLHNPIRVGTIDGEEADSSSTLTPQIVKVPIADIIRIARTLPPRDDESY